MVNNIVDNDLSMAEMFDNSQNEKSNETEIRPISKINKGNMSPTTAKMVFEEQKRIAKLKALDEEQERCCQRDIVKSTKFQEIQFKENSCKMKKVIQNNENMEMSWWNKYKQDTRQLFGMQNNQHNHNHD